MQSLKNYLMKKPTLLFIIILYSISGNTQNIRYSTIQSISPFYSKKINGKEVMFTTKVLIDIYSLNDEKIYKVFPNRDSKTLDLMPNSESYFIVQNNATEGSFYRCRLNENDFIKSKMKTDSFLNVFVHGNPNIVYDTTFYNVTIYSSNDTLFVKSKLKDSKQLNYYDSVTFKLRNFNNEPVFNLSKKLEKQFNKQLFYASFYHRKKFSKLTGKVPMAHEYILELIENELDTADSQKFTEFIHKLKSTYK
jgi:hypothetical protein